MKQGTVNLLLYSQIPQFFENSGVKRFYNMEIIRSSCRVILAKSAIARLAHANYSHEKVDML
jgi:hypothetical protein